MLKVVRSNSFVKTLLFSIPLALCAGGAAFADTVDYTVTVQPSLNITLSANNVVLDLNPNTKTSDAKDLGITVKTNNLTGYKLNMSSTGNATDLVRDNTVDGKNATIPTLSAAAGTTASSLSDNTWGYRVNNTGNFIPYVSGTTILENNRFTNEDTATLSFASKINYSQAAGTYQIGLTLTGVANQMMNYIQNLSPTLCTSTPQTVLDIRDNQEYVIQRLRDGNCWMMTNLNLGAIELEEDLTSENTNLSNTISAATFNSWKKTVGSGTSGYNTGEFIPLTTSNTSDGRDVDRDNGEPYGTLYNFHAASAGTVTGTSYSTNATYDICPAGWRLPTGGNSAGEYYDLYSIPAYDSFAKMHGSISNNGAAFTLSGWIDNSAPQKQGDAGVWWSSTAYPNSNSMYTLYVNTWDTRYPDIMTYNNTYRYDALSIRCVMKDTRTINDITYMQDINKQIIANTADAATTTLKDARDNQVYNVTKINGKVWMTRNIAIGCDGSGSAYGPNRVNRTLASQNSNVSSDWSTGTALSLDKTDETTGCTTSSTSDCNSYTTARMKCDSTYGAWYNYVALTAGTITGSSNSTNATYDICPVGWRLATSAEQSAILSYRALFNPVETGVWVDGVLGYTDWGVWHSSTAPNAQSRNTLYINNGTFSTSAGYRYNGYTARCVTR